jgi:DNA-directed RNA polymerase subunit RPC12/RpoP
MKVICDNCGAMYKIPDEKLAKPVNKATCRQCGHRMLIPRPRRGADPDERTLVTAVPPTPPPAASRASVPVAPSLPMSLVEHEEKTAPTGGRGVDETRWVRNDVPARPQPAASAVAVSTSDPGDRAPAMTERVPAHAPAVHATAPVKPQPARQTPPLRAVPAEPQFGDDEVDLDDEVATAVEVDAAPPRAPAKTPAPKTISKGTPAKAPDRPAPAQASPTRAPVDGAATSAFAAHDPRGDLGLALFGVFAAGLGATLLAVSSVLDANGSLYAVDLVLSALGTALTVGGIVGTGLVLLSGGRGRKPAWRAVSVTLGLLAGIGLGGLPAAARVTYDMFGHFQGDMGDLMASVTPEAPVAADPVIPPVTPVDPAVLAAPADPVLETPPVDLGAPPEAGDLAPAGTADPAPSTSGSSTSSSPPVSTTNRTSAGTSSTAGSATRTSTNRTTSGSSSRTSATDDLLTQPAPTRTLGATPRTLGATPPSGGTKPPPRDLTDDEERDLEDDIGLSKPSSTPAPASNLPATPPLAAVDVMIKSNVGIKKCFFEHQRTEGALPPKIEVKFTIKPTGDSTGYEVKQPKYQGSELESCLIRSMRAITFPPSQQGTTLTFPFVFG